MQLIKGKNLTAQQVEEVKARWVYRYTVDNPRIHQHFFRGYPTQTDVQWINDHAFYVRKDGHLSNVHNHCEPEFLVTE